MTRFEWDVTKARTNVRVHSVSFDEAKTVFAGTLGVTVPDVVHSEDEERWTTIGLSDRKRLLVVVHSERGGNIRLISARKATAAERRQYEED
ncbi:MAG: BrnT family toxin [Acidobacteriota bacterium]|nr:BrnT family toxin [Acidobacteriota bacterium]